ncbi:MAG: SOS response-associated peptidase, partial [Pseudomonadota bacterium]
MCNLHSNTMSHEAMRRLFDVSLNASSLGNFAAQPAIYPKGEAAIVRTSEDGGRRLDLSSWGFLTPNKSKKT